MTDAAPVQDPAELTRYIEARFHVRHRTQLPPLVQMARSVETVHLGEDHRPGGLSDILRRMIGEMEVHMKKEELILFPAIRKGGRPGIEGPIAIMRADHDNHAAEVAEIRRLTEDLTLPEGACGTWAALYAGLEEFINDFEEHMRLENDVLFPQFERGVAAND